MDRLTSMAVFVRTADLGSFAATADAMGMSPQMVAKHIVHLEDRLGTVLINRTTRRQSLTDIGRSFYERCRLILAEAEAAEELAHEMHSQPRGILKVSAPVTFGAFSLSPFTTRYLMAHPQMRVDLVLDDRFIDPLEHGFEVLIRIGDIEDSALIAHPLLPYRLIACAAPRYLQERGVPATPADLAAHACLPFSHIGSATPCRWQFSRDGRTQEVKVSGPMSSNNWTALLHAAIDGFGVTLGPEIVLAGEVAAGRLMRILPEYTGPQRPMHLLYPAARRPTAKLRSFVKAVLAEFGPA